MSRRELKIENNRTGFKIGGTVGIIILLLGIAILFGIYQMSLVSHQIIEISEEYTPLQEILNEVKVHQISQEENFKKVIYFTQNNDSTSLEEAKSGFWFSSGIINTELTRAKNIIDAGYKSGFAEKLDTNLDIQSLILEIEQLHYSYVEDIRNIISINENSQNKILPLNEIQGKELQLQKSIDSLINEISIAIDESTNQIEKNESDALIGQVIIISLVGVIATTLGFFLSQINRDLQKEVTQRTQELKDANERLKKLDERKDEFIGIASHELKSPIQPIFGFAELAKAGDIDQKEAWDGVTILAKQLQDLANDVLDVNRIESNRLVLDKEKISLNDLILNTIHSLNVGLNDVIIQENLDEDIEIRVDRLRMEQVLRNLFNNAIKFTSKGTITFSTQINKKEEIATITIKDSGSGIPEDILSKIFEKFITKGHESENKTGTGLGLFLCKGIIESHGGRIWAHNNPEKGATFEFTIPISKKYTEKLLQKNNFTSV